MHHSYNKLGIITKYYIQSHLQWLIDVFLAYLDEWEASVKARKDHDFTKGEKCKMLLSKETLLGIKMTGTAIATLR